MCRTQSPGLTVYTNAGIHTYYNYRQIVLGPRVKAFLPLSLYIGRMSKGQALECAVHSADQVLVSCDASERRTQIEARRQYICNLTVPT